MKEDGVIPDQIRDGICELVSEANVPANTCMQAFDVIAHALGHKVEGSVSKWSVNRIMKEGGLALRIHATESFQKADGIGISSNGTTNKNNNWESHCAEVTDKNGNCADFFLGISMAVNHTSKTQRDGWIELVDELYNVFKESPFNNGEADIRDFWTTVTGMHTDHAKDQKKLFRLLKDFKRECDREKRGQKVVEGLNSHSIEFLTFQLRVALKAAEVAGGDEVWNRLSMEERA
ncbi:hypothetical protein AAF712_016712 [Marasmius tenuissimus]|uniref:Uncharacterized protein n=1 Tax=Marasmius tenuissimus TaxID=585030 RepID=A0ABR2Z5D6_9AGAR